MALRCRTILPCSSFGFLLFLLAFSRRIWKHLQCDGPGGNPRPFFVYVESKIPIAAMGEDLKNYGENPNFEKSPGVTIKKDTIRNLLLFKPMKIAITRGPRGNSIPFSDTSPAKLPEMIGDVTGLLPAKSGSSLDPRNNTTEHPILPSNFLWTFAHVS